MLLDVFGFLRLSLIDILDILLVAVIIFVVFRWIRGSSAMSIFAAIISLYILRFIVGAFNMKLMSGILGQLLDVGVIALIIIFQPEIRRFLISFGNNYLREFENLPEGVNLLVVDGSKPIDTVEMEIRKYLSSFSL